MGRWLRWGCSTFGLVMTVLVGVGPDQAVSNLSAWLALVTTSDLPSWILSPDIDVWGFGFGFILICVGPVGFFLIKKKITILPDTNIGQAIEYVAGILCPVDDDSEYWDITRENTMVTKAITEKFRNGELLAWGNRIEVIPAHGGLTYKNFTTKNDKLFTVEDWEVRQLSPFAEGIVGNTKPQTESHGGNEDHIQFAGLMVNFEQVKKLWHKSQ